MIPKIIHYCWFGRNEKSAFIEQCISSWREYLPDYELIEWNEGNFDVNISVFTTEAYFRKKWAFISDYVRAYALYNVGGVYLDTDVEIRNNLNSFLHHGAFSGFEGYGSPFTALWGAQRGHVWPKKIINYYDGLKGFDGTTNTEIITSFLVDHYKVNPFNDSYQELSDNICIYPSNFFCLNLDLNYAVHHFDGSWLEFKNPNCNSNLKRKYYKSKFLSYYDSKQIIESLHEEELFKVKDLIIYIFKRIKKKCFKFFIKKWSLISKQRMDKSLVLFFLI